MSIAEPQVAGAYTALITPFGADGLTVDAKAFATHARWIHEQSMGGLVAFGTTGEGPWLSVDEQLGCLEALGTDLLADTLVAVTTQAVSDTLSLARVLRGSGLRGLLLLPPYYFGAPRVADLRRYFEAVANVADVPLLGYHIPKYAPPVPLELVADDVLTGVKDSSGDQSFSRSVIEAGGCVLWGSEGSVHSLDVPVHGFVSASANVVPELVGPVTDCLTSLTVGAVTQRMADVRRHTGGSGQPWLLKRLAAERHGHDLGPCRPPSSASGACDLHDVLAAAGLDGPLVEEGTSRG